MPEIRYCDEDLLHLNLIVSEFFYNEFESLLVIAIVKPCILLRKNSSKYDSNERDLSGACSDD